MSQMTKVRLGVYTYRAEVVLKQIYGDSVYLEPDNEIYLQFYKVEPEEAKKKIVEELEEYAKKIGRRDEDLRDDCLELSIVLRGKKNHSYIIGQPLDPLKAASIQILNEEYKTTRRKYDDEIRKKEFERDEKLRQIADEMSRLRDRRLEDGIHLVPADECLHTDFAK